MPRLAWLALLPLLGCASLPQNQGTADAGGYAGIVQRVVRVVRRGADLPGMGLLGQLGGRLGAMLRQNAETHQYIVRTPRGQIIAQSDDEFPVGACVEVVPQTNRAGPAFRFGEAVVVKSENCSG